MGCAASARATAVFRSRSARVGVGGFHSVRHAGKGGAGQFAIANENGQPARFPRGEESLWKPDLRTGAEEQRVVSMRSELNQLFFAPKWIATRLGGIDGKAENQFFRAIPGKGTLKAHQVWDRLLPALFNRRSCQWLLCRDNGHG